MKIQRHAKIVELINQYDIDTQEELARRLNQAGFRVTQATVSRDIRELRLTKVAVDGGKQKYVVMNTPEQRTGRKISAYFAGWLCIYGYGTEYTGNPYSIWNGDGCGSGNGCAELEGNRRLYCRG